MEHQIIFTDEMEILNYNTHVRAYYHGISYGNIPVHTHNFHELNIILAGTGKHYINDTVHDITCGDIFIISPKVRHGYEFDNNDYSIFHLLFHKSFFEKYKSYLSALSGYKILFDIEPQIRETNQTLKNFLHIDITQNYNLTRTFDELVALCSSPKANAENQKEFLALYVIAKICEMIHEEEKENKEKRYLYDMLKSIEYIHMNFAEEIHLETLLKISHMSRSSYLRHFKEMFHLTPHEYIRNYCLRHAKTLLKHTDASLTSIANECGFYDSSHFCKLFRKKYHISPAKYRLMSKNQNT